MSTALVPLTVVSTLATNYFWAQVAIGSNVLQQQPPNRSYWFLVIDRRTLKVVYNQLQSAPNQAPNLGAYNTPDYILVVATLGMGLDSQPQGALFDFLDANGAGAELRRVDQVATQLNCGSLGTFGYALVSVLGNLNQPGFEASQITNPNTGPILTVQLMPSDVNGQTYYTPVALSNA